MVIGGITSGLLTSITMSSTLTSARLLNKSILSPEDVKELCVDTTKKELSKYEKITHDIVQKKYISDEDKKFVVRYDFLRTMHVLHHEKFSWKDYLYRKTLANKWFVPSVTVGSIAGLYTFGVFVSKRGIIDNVVEKVSSIIKLSK
jgi:hypothetical protein